MHFPMNRLVAILLLLFENPMTAVNLKDRVVTAVNCGGEEALGAYGIIYSADFLEDGIISDVGMRYAFLNADRGDALIYQTERWSKNSFQYEVAVNEGAYVIILKFSEVYFPSSGKKVFDVLVNSMTVIKDLDIFDESGGRGFAYDVYIPIAINNNRVTINGHSTAYDGKIVIEFAKGAHDNPKVNGFAILRGTIDDLPPPPEKYVSGTLPEEFDLYENDDYVKTDEINARKSRDEESENEEEMFSATTGSENPFEKESVDLLIPIVSALIIIIPIAYVIQLRLTQN